MIRIVSILILAVSMISVAGCASVSKADEQQSEKAKSITASDTKGTVFLYRTGRMVGAAGQLSVKVNGQEAGGTGPGTFFRWDLNPGTYTFFSSTSESSATVPLKVQAGKVYYIRQDARIGLDSGRVSMKEVSSSQGQKEVQGCKLLVSSYMPES